jgi:hypothetical protein
VWLPPRGVKREPLSAREIGGIGVADGETDHTGYKAAIAKRFHGVYESIGIGGSRRIAIVLRGALANANADGIRRPRAPFVTSDGRHGQRDRRDWWVCPVPQRARLDARPAAHPALRRNLRDS